MTERERGSESESERGREMKKYESKYSLKTFYFNYKATKTRHRSIFLTCSLGPGARREAGPLSERSADGAKRERTAPLPRFRADQSIIIINIIYWHSASVCCKGYLGFCRYQFETVI